MSASTVLPTRRRSTQVNGWRAVVAAIVPAAIVASVLDAVVAAIAHGAGVSHAFKPLHTASFVSLTIIGIAIGAAGWSLVRSRAADPRRTLSLLVPVVLVLSFIPDVAIGAQKTMSATTWGGVVALMAMHLIVAAVAVAAYVTFLPVRNSAGRAGV